MSETVTQADEATLGLATAAKPATKTPRRLRDILCLDDFEEPARRMLPRRSMRPTVGAGKCPGMRRVPAAACSSIRRMRVRRESSRSVQATVDHCGCINWNW